MHQKKVIHCFKLLLRVYFLICSCNLFFAYYEKFILRKKIMRKYLLELGQIINISTKIHIGRPDWASPTILYWGNQIHLYRIKPKSKEGEYEIWVQARTWGFTTIHHQNQALYIWFQNTSIAKNMNWRKVWHVFQIRQLNTLSLLKFGTKLNT